MHVWICGCVSGGRSAAPVFREMLGVMEKFGLGYESCGIATVQNGKLIQMKNVGSGGYSLFR